MKLQRSIGPISLLFTAVGGIVGSGWLFGPLYAAQIAGPAAIISWVIGGILMLFIALTFAELAAAYPRTGGLIHYGNMSHGPVTSFTIGWMIWLSSVVVAPIETLALLQYSANYLPYLMHTVDGAKSLTSFGIICAALLMALMVYLNAMGAKFFSQSSNAIVLIKLIVPLMIVIVLLAIDFHISNFSAQGGFMPNGWKGVITALPLGGIVFSFIGYSPAIQLGGEATNPQRAIPFAVVGAVAISMVLYTLIQTSFIGALKPEFLLQGWSKLSFTGDAGPFAGILMAFGVMWLVVVIYADAIISPFGTAYIYTAGTGRTTYALSEIGFFARQFMDLNKTGVPLKAMVLNYVVGLFLFLPFNGWQAMAGFLISCFIISYSMGPLSLAVLRKTDPTTPRPFKVPFHQVSCLLAFYVCNLLLLWTGWHTIKLLLIAIAIGTIFLLYSVVKDRKGIWRGQLQKSWWLILYIIGIGVLTYLGSFGGGINLMPFGVDFAVEAIFTLIIYILAVKTNKA